MYRLIGRISRLVVKGICQFYFCSWCLLSQRVSRQFISLVVIVVMFCVMICQQVQVLCLCGGVVSRMQVVVGLVLLFQVRFCSRWVNISSSGVVGLMLLQLGSIVMLLVFSVIRNRVRSIVGLCLMWLVQVLIRIVLRGWMMKLMLNVVIDRSRLMKVLLEGKKVCLIIIVKVVQILKLKNFMVLLRIMVKMLWWLVGLVVVGGWVGECMVKVFLE